MATTAETSQPPEPERQHGKMPEHTPLIEAHRPALDAYEELYKKLHANPELSHCEQETAQVIVEHLAQHQPDGYQVTAHIGGHGVAAVLRNGAGPTILLRADTDALPIQEKTGLAYASTKRMRDADGVEQPVMHACGHDMHVTGLLAAAQLLFAARATWSGTLVLVFQPAEEKGKGAQAMVDDGLYTRHGVPEPDVAIGAHVMPHAAGVVGTRSGLIASAADSLKITIHGRGAHASQPHRALDPVVSAAFATTRLQTLVARETSPYDPAVVTVASIQAGHAENVIPASAEMKVDLRSSSAAVRKRLNAGVRRIVAAECAAGNAPHPPDFETLRSFPLTDNDPRATARLDEAMRWHFGREWNGTIAPLGGSEDFPNLATAINKPYVYWIYGGTDPAFHKKMLDEDREAEIPINHSSFFAPVIQPTLTRAVDGYAVSALAWMAKTKAEEA